MSSRFLILSMKVCGHLKPLRIETRMQRLFSANTMASTATSAAQGPESGNQIHQKIAGRQRFYKVVGVKESADGKGFHVTLDGSSIPPSANYLLSVLSTLMYTHLNVHRKGSENSRFVHETCVFTNILMNTMIWACRSICTYTARHPLILPNRYLATLLACEWDFQTDKRRGIEPVSMPITQLIFTAIDQISLDPETTRKVCMSYLPTGAVWVYVRQVGFCSHIFLFIFRYGAIFCSRGR